MRSWPRSPARRWQCRLPGGGGGGAGSSSLSHFPSHMQPWISPLGQAGGGLTRCPPTKHRKPHPLHHPEPPPPGVVGPRVGPRCLLNLSVAPREDSASSGHLYSAEGLCTALDLWEPGSPLRQARQRCHSWSRWGCRGEGEGAGHPEAHQHLLVRFASACRERMS